ncbi:nucleoside/nucleotide kinase family protein [Superficieibacter electus]|uniref:Nucleoside/nucleotide kinase family protein n=1 Tax=Superficieibacter electus TaxID=2022662 RepID=A0A2P5GT02_9ENTR|nr:nucleoside/nucleotide kinase family protein [Superficieibacter electus]POP46221.1 nucleoside/nucleotide kinase family protein [Superficieibacter electus]POP49691.1 nucleoside/nucleotide kinase family protein [Superficieibacter electus]
MKISLRVNGLQTEVDYAESDIETVHKPLLRRLENIRSTSPYPRTIIFLSAPPGTGKSTLTTFWETLSREDPTLLALQTLPMDGFHHYNRWLDETGLRPFKGAPETFDVEKLAQNLRQIREGEGCWPQYDRQKHDPEEAAIQVTAPIVIVEGNWLLLDDERWHALREFCDFSIFIKAPPDVLRQRLIHRKIAGGLSAQEAQAFYLRTDGPNVERVLTGSLPADLTLEMTPEGGYRY